MGAPPSPRSSSMATWAAAPLVTSPPPPYERAARGCWRWRAGDLGELRRRGLTRWCVVPAARSLGRGRGIGGWRADVYRRRPEAWEEAWRLPFRSRSRGRGIATHTRGRSFAAGSRGRARGRSRLGEAGSTKGLPESSERTTWTLEGGGQQPPVDSVRRYAILQFSFLLSMIDLGRFISAPSSTMRVTSFPSLPGSSGCGKDGHSRVYHGTRGNNIDASWHRWCDTPHALSMLILDERVRSAPDCRPWQVHSAPDFGDVSDECHDHYAIHVFSWFAFLLVLYFF
jgi:hypothetical protein